MKKDMNQCAACKTGENETGEEPVQSRAKKSAYAVLLKRLRSSEEIFLILTSILVGLGAGVGAILFRYLIKGVEWVGYTWVPMVTAGWGKAYVVFVPAVGGLLVGLLVYNFAREAKGHGVPEVMEAVALRGGRIRPVVAIVKSLASSLSIGSGGSVGREGPIVQIGSALGSTIGQWFHLSDERIRNLVACGAAGGIAATFNAPIAGVIFALEVILAEFRVNYFSTVVISAVSASVIAQAVFGDLPAFPIPVEYQINHVIEFAFYPLLGVLAAFVGVIFVKVLYAAEDLFESWKAIPEWFQPAVGGAMLGVVALVYPLFTPLQWEKLPQIFNVGYDVIEEALLNHTALAVVLLLLILKLLATALTLGSGGSGGIFAPGLFMGAMLGAAFGILMNTLFPGIPAPAGAYALVGMAAVFSASAHAPITAVIILFELTGDYKIILPLMLTVVIATLISRHFLKGESIYTLKLSRRGVRLRAGRDVDILQGVLVSDVMTTDVSSAAGSLTIDQLSDLFNHSRFHQYPVLDEKNNLEGMVSIGEMESAIYFRKDEELHVDSICTPYHHLVLTFPDESIGDVMTKMGPRGLAGLPVVSRENPRKLVGLVSRTDIIRAYDLALTRRNELSRKVEQVRARQPEGTEWICISLAEGDRAVGKKVSEVAKMLPEDCILISIHREGRVIIPHGTTVLQNEDRISAITLKSSSDTVQGCLVG
ncbi:MAG: chloride channel protein [Anaerolineales bacterium]|nr:chloride channel protein [Anaerolineales bacterium]